MRRDPPCGIPIPPWAAVRGQVLEHASQAARLRGRRVALERVVERGFRDGLEAIEVVNGLAQRGVPLGRRREEAVLAVLDRAAKRVGRRGNAGRPDNRRLEVLQLRLAVCELVVLERDDVELDLADQPLQVQEVLERKELDPIAKPPACSGSGP